MFGDETNYLLEKTHCSITSAGSVRSHSHVSVTLGPDTRPYTPGVFMALRCHEDGKDIKGF